MKLVGFGRTWRSQRTSQPARPRFKNRTWGTLLVTVTVKSRRLSGPIGTQVEMMSLLSGAPGNSHADWIVRQNSPLSVVTLIPRSTTNTRHIVYV